MPQESPRLPYRHGICVLPFPKYSTLHPAGHGNPVKNTFRQNSPDEGAVPDHYPEAHTGPQGSMASCLKLKHLSYETGSKKTDSK